MTIPFHPGELDIQARAGVLEQVAAFGQRAIRTYMPDQHREFFAQLPWLLAAGLDVNGQPQASVLWGEPGFAHTPEATLLRVNALPQADDPLAGCLHKGWRLGLLGLELPTRRRNRLNGRIVARDSTGFTVLAEQSFGNCPRYIQARTCSPHQRQAGPSLQGHGLAEDWLSLVRRSDTLFIASQHSGEHNGGVDVSHRGGPLGFVELGQDGRLWLPDYSGNNLFNTLGNLLLEPRCALLFIDFASGDLLHLEARAEILWPANAGHPLPPGALRMVALEPGRWTLRRSRLPLQFGDAEPSPHLPGA
ncbi:flavin-nucleotide-binding protein [Pseudomonas cavernae]|uniref:Flavin-nucleotide-binding protein n=1 Tax=Pseudomonas cavernae TaxID=2320867 RepID=A0A385Z755_9PSED|nr:pyridoxamine 5'-phosphate oxidase family protein [Pseudomonas cavernae]AYC33468.1 flavin-nucleotide-binding protein [Pseudomonas cavernae]